MMDIFKQLNAARKNGKSPEKNSPPRNINACKFCGSNELVETLDGFQTVCMNCGRLQGEAIYRKAANFNNNGRLLVHNVLVRDKEDITYIERYVEGIYKTMYPLKDDKPVVWFGYTKEIYTKLLKNRNIKLHGTSLSVICGIIIECMMIKNKIPIIRPKMIEYIIETAGKLEKKGKITSKTYEDYRLGKKLGLREVLEDAGCMNARPSIYEYTKFPMNQMNFTKHERHHVSQLCEVLDKMRNENHQLNDIIIRKTNDEIAACIIFMVGYQGVAVAKPDKVMGISIGVILPMYDAIKKSMNLKIQSIVSNYKSKDDIFVRKERKVNNKFRINGKICESMSKEEIIRISKTKGFTESQLLTKSGKYKSKQEMCKLMLQNNVAARNR